MAVLTFLIVANLSIDGVADTRIVVGGAGAPVTLVDVQTAWVEVAKSPVLLPFTFMVALLAVKAKQSFSTFSVTVDKYLADPGSLPLSIA